MPRNDSADWAEAISMPVDFATVADFDHPDGKFGILYRIDDAVIPLANAIFFLSGELFRSRWAGIFGKAADTLDDSLQVAPGDGGKIPPDRVFEKYVIGGH